MVCDGYHDKAEFGPMTCSYDPDALTPEIPRLQELVSLGLPCCEVFTLVPIFQRARHLVPHRVHQMRLGLPTLTGRARRSRRPKQ